MDELSAFGEWFLSGQFEEEYALHRLAETLEITHWTRRYREVLARLANLSEEFPEMALRCLQHLASARDTKTVSFHGEAEKSTRRILEVALANSSPNLADEAQVELPR
jgi:NTP pyrophosphatase (non-canonical NTP hydrolase)